MAEDLKRAGLSRVNISLDTLDPDQFHMVTRVGYLEDTLAGIDAALAAGFDPVKINAVTVRSLNQDFLGFARLSVDRPLHVRFIEYMPVGESSGFDGCGWSKKDVIPSEELLETINAHAREEGMDELVPAGADRRSAGALRATTSSRGRRARSASSPAVAPLLLECNRIRLTADGKIRPCLFSDTEYDVKSARWGRRRRRGSRGAVRGFGREARRAS